MQSYMGIHEPVVFFDVLLHIGTLGAVLVVFNKEVAAIYRDGVAALSRSKPISELPHAWMMLMILLGSVPAGVIGILFEDVFERFFALPLPVGFFLLVTGAVLFMTRKAGRGIKTIGQITPSTALLIGLAQAMAITPGISRSGATIAVALFLGLERETAAKFSFLLSVPAIAGAMLLKSFSVTQLTVNVPNYAAGLASAFVIGLVSLVWLVKLVKKGKLDLFAYYCWGVGLLVILSYAL